MTVSSDDVDVQQVDAHSNELIHVVVIERFHLQVAPSTTARRHNALYYYHKYR